ncbi:hypothetical protein PLICRDRAFT_653089 [Plicaturopsis crispa FD-325 SS-3]|nr:hypothetical protein PLICRDRAFT_653089 [Plicaturopsis crispa FD-325 SS-3]
MPQLETLETVFSDSPRYWTSKSPGLTPCASIYVPSVRTVTILGDANDCIDFLAVSAFHPNAKVTVKCPSSRGTIAEMAYYCSTETRRLELRIDGGYEPTTTTMGSVNHLLRLRCVDSLSAPTHFPPGSPPSPTSHSVSQPAIEVYLHDGRYDLSRVWKCLPRKSQVTQIYLYDCAPQVLQCVADLIAPGVPVKVNAAASDPHLAATPARNLTTSVPSTTASDAHRSPCPQLDSFWRNSTGHTF